MSTHSTATSSETSAEELGTFALPVRAAQTANGWRFLFQFLHHRGQYSHAVSQVYRGLLIEVANIASKNELRPLSTNSTPLFRNNLRHPSRNTPLQNSKNPERRAAFAIVRMRARAIFVRFVYG